MKRPPVGETLRNGPPRAFASFSGPPGRFYSTPPESFRPSLFRRIVFFIAGVNNTAIIPKLFPWPAGLYAFVFLKFHPRPDPVYHAFIFFFFIMIWHGSFRVYDIVSDHYRNNPIHFKFLLFGFFSPPDLNFLPWVAVVMVLFVLFFNSDGVPTPSGGFVLMRKLPRAPFNLGPPRPPNAGGYNLSRPKPIDTSSAPSPRPTPEVQPQPSPPPPPPGPDTSPYFESAKSVVYKIGATSTETVGGHLLVAAILGTAATLGATDYLSENLEVQKVKAQAALKDADANLLNAQTNLKRLELDQKKFDFESSKRLEVLSSEKEGCTLSCPLEEFKHPWMLELFDFFDDGCFFWFSLFRAVFAGLAGVFVLVKVSRVIDLVVGWGGRDQPRPELLATSLGPGKGWVFPFLSPAGALEIDPETLVVLVGAALPGGLILAGAALRRWLTSSVPLLRVFPWWLPLPVGVTLSARGDFSYPWFFHAVGVTYGGVYLSAVAVDHLRGRSRPGGGSALPPGFGFSWWPGGFALLFTSLVGVSGLFSGGGLGAAFEPVQQVRNLYFAYGVYYLGLAGGFRWTPPGWVVDFFESPDDLEPTSVVGGLTKAGKATVLAAGITGAAGTASYALQEHYKYKTEVEACRTKIELCRIKSSTKVSKLEATVADKRVDLEANLQSFNIQHKNNKRLDELEFKYHELGVPVRRTPTEVIPQTGGSWYNPFGGSFRDPADPPGKALVFFLTTGEFTLNRVATAWVLEVLVFAVVFLRGRVSSGFRPGWSGRAGHPGLTDPSSSSFTPRVGTDLEPHRPGGPPRSGDRINELKPKPLTRASTGVVQRLEHRFVEPETRVRFPSLVVGVWRNGSRVGFRIRW